MKNLVKRIYVSILTVTAVIIIGSCTFPFQQGQHAVLSDIRGQLEHNYISRLAFMGGSVLFNPDQLSSGHLMPGAHVAVRLGRVDRNVYNPNEPEFLDSPGDARYGFITIIAIDTSSVTFSYSQYDATGRFVTTSNHTLRLNETVDINGDGILDLTFVRPERTRPGMENAVFLTFLSSQETQNTSMFAVFPEQYSRGVFPSGIMGINPDGRFIVTRYELVGSTVRAAVQGLVYGDFVINYQTGAFQKVTGSRNFRHARMILDSDVTDISASERTDLYFIVEEFDDLLMAHNLFMALPDAVRNLHNPPDFTNAGLVPILNNILESYDLILSIAAVQDVGLTDSELEEVRSGIHHLPLEELVQVNRLFLNDIFPNVTPQLQNNSDCIAFILPLLHLTIRGESNDEVNEIDVSRRAANSFSDYTVRRNAILSNWRRFRPLGGITPDLSFQIPGTNINVSHPSSLTNQVNVGILGVLENNWGSTIRMNIGVAIFLQVEWGNADISENFYRRSLLPNRRPISLVNISAPAIWIGPVLLNINMPITFDIVLSVTGNLSYSTPWFTGLTALYGAEASVGANYGIRWRRVLFARLPQPYFSPFFRTNTISEFVYFSGPQDSNFTVASFEVELPIGNTGASVGAAIDNAFTIVELAPSVAINPNVSAWGLVSVGFAVNSSLIGRFTVTALPNTAQLMAQRRLPFSGNASLHYQATFYGTGRVGISTTLLGIRLNFGQNFSARIANFNTQIGSTVRVF
ncbi:MAG: hypothetical protein FWC64_08790 [Treponema sp.]|nr:hypothetical protein [Treponema sp.]